METTMECKKNRILIADDDMSLLTIMEDALSPHFEIVLASDGNKAKQLIDTEQFMFVILDVHLPEIEGLDLCKYIFENSNSIKPHIVVLSQDIHDDVIRTAYSFNVDDYIIKPICPIAVVQRMLRLEKDIFDFSDLDNLRKQTLSMADTAMKQASEYGNALELIAKLNQISKPQELAKEVAIFFNKNDIFTAIQLRSENQIINYDIDSVDCSEVKLKIFQVLHTEGRIYSFGRRTIFNDDHISILVKNMPRQDSHAYGMLVDIAAKLIPAINYRFISLCNEQAISDSVTTLSNAMSMIRRGITSMEMEKRDIIALLISQISASFHELELTDQQEQFFINLIENHLENKEISDDFLNVKEVLEDCLSSVQAAKNMTISTIEVIPEQSEYLDVELF
ncbi:response regulator transcription factor [Shewanella sp. TC10]|uniref:response regulator transcription factor n=1 Tax=Shewanella sp. TC10 TaxID=1419739 RepID=UPI00129EDEE2|nr:response regulator [Shewanella sp. TC10]